jgi:hypothetical protein
MRGGLVPVIAALFLRHLDMRAQQGTHLVGGGKGHHAVDAGARLAHEVHRHIQAAG